MRSASAPFAGSHKQQETYYDLFYDYPLIEASFAQQYGIRLRYEDDMSFDEFKTLLAGLNGDTPLGTVVRIRSERDSKVLKSYTAEQKRIRTEWRNFRAGNMLKQVKTNRDEYDMAMKGFADMFRGLARGG